MGWGGRNLTGLEIKSLVEKYVDITIDSDDALEVINEAMDKIGDLGLVYGQVTLVAEADTPYRMPADATIVTVILEDGETADGWTFRGGAIRFARAGTYTIIARRNPEHIELIEEELDLHPSYQRSVVTYLRGWFKLKDDDESPDGHRLMQQFRAEVDHTFALLRRQYSPKTIKVVR